MKRALIVTYAFPPTAGAGVGRALKLCKFLPEWGVETTILTVSNPSVPATDPTLMRDIPPQTDIIRVPTLEPGYATKQAVNAQPTAGATTAVARLKSKAVHAAKAVLVPDPQVLWQPGALWGLARAMHSKPDVVLITAPPFSQFLLAPVARLARDVPVVLDYRDEWTTCRTAYENAGPVQQWVGERLEGVLVKNAAAIVTATEAFRNNLLERFEFLREADVTAIPNGYDPDDFPGERPPPPVDKFTITYAGTIFRLTRPRSFLQALRLLHARDPRLAETVRVRFIGRVVDSEKADFADAQSLGVELLGYQEKAFAIRESHKSHLNLCLLDDLEENRHIYPAKVFELMYMGRPSLTIAPDGALADLVRAHHLGQLARPDDIESIYRVLRDALQAFVGGTYSIEQNAQGIERFHRRALAGEFVEVFRRAQRQHQGRAA